VAARLRVTAFRVVATCLAALAAAAMSCSGPLHDRGSTVTTSTPSVPEGWRRVEIDAVASLAAPPDMVAQSVQPIDSIFGILRGEHDELVYDYGRYGEDLSSYADQAGFSSRSRDVEGRQGREVSFRMQGGSSNIVRILQVPDRGKVLTIRMSCTDEETCRSADAVFDSLRFAPP